jgi:hypothetical protein
VVENVPFKIAMEKNIFESIGLHVYAYTAQAGGRARAQQSAKAKARRPRSAISYYPDCDHVWSYGHHAYKLRLRTLTIMPFKKKHVFFYIILKNPNEYLYKLPLDL